MNFRELIRGLFTQEKPEPREFEWCLVGNIVDKHYYGENKEIRRGTKQFGPGTKVYCLPEYGGTGHDKIRVLGKPRRKRRLINIAINSSLIKNIRVQKVYSSEIKQSILENSYYSTWKMEENEAEILEKFAVSLNGRSEEVA